MKYSLFSIVEHKSQGQVLLIVVITMIVALTAGLSIASRTITNLKLSKQNQESQRAFQAAQSGIEKFLASGTGGNSAFNNASFDTSVTSIDQSERVLNNGISIDQDRGADVWLSQYPDYSSKYSGGLTIYWGGKGQTACVSGQGDKSIPALEIVILSGVVGLPTFTRYSYDPCNASATRGNGFATPGGGTYTTSAASNIPGTVFLYSTTLPAVSNGLIMKVIPIYNSTIIGVKFTPSGGSTVPSEGRVITSTGTSGDTKRKVLYYESYPQLPNEIFPYSILSQ